MKKEELEFLKNKLLEQRQEIIENARRTLESEMKLDINELPDEMDLATTEFDMGMTFRLRGREKSLLKKIDFALKQIERGTYGICENCGREIGFNRLSVRPVATLCVQCKEEQERKERQFL